MTHPRLLKQQSLLLNQGFTIEQNEESHIMVGFKGPVNSPYQNGHFYVKVNTTNYPFRQPNFHFKTPIIHPFINLNDNNQIPCCLISSTCNCLKDIRAYQGEWTPLRKIIVIFRAIIRFLEDPQLNPQRWVQFGHANNQQYIEKAKQFTKLFAFDKNYLQYDNNIDKARDYNSVLIRMGNKQVCQICFQTVKPVIEKSTSFECGHKFHQKCLQVNQVQLKTCAYCTRV